MISDVLHDAIVEIEKYQEKCPAAYDEMKDEIDEVKGHMQKLQRKLDTPPYDTAC